MVVARKLNYIAPSSLRLREPPPHHPSRRNHPKIELGLEWFALGPNGSQKRRVLGSMVENGATSLPKIFIGGTPLGGAAGYSALAESIESGELEGLLKKSGAKLAR